MRIGTWNLAGRWDDRHRALLETMDCDVLLLTEVSERLDVRGFDLHLGQQLMAPKRRWAAVASRLPASPEPDPHGASAMVDTGGSACLLLHPAVALLWHARPMGGCHKRGEDQRRCRRGRSQCTFGLGRRLEPRPVWQGVGRLGRRQAVAARGC